MGRRVRVWRRRRRRGIKEEKKKIRGRRKEEEGGRPQLQSLFTWRKRKKDKRGKGKVERKSDHRITVVHT